MSLLLLRKRPLLRDGFAGTDGDALNTAIWTAQLGAMQITSGRGVGKTLALDGNAMLSNVEFAADTTGWTAFQATLARVDSEVEPGVNSGGVDKWCLRVPNDGAASGFGYQSIAGVVGVTYTVAARGYSPSANTTVNAARLHVVNLGADTSVLTTVENTWQALTTDIAATGTAGIFRLRVQGTVAGDKAYFDAASCQAKAIIYTCNPGIADVAVKVQVTLPASGVVPKCVSTRVPSNPCHQKLS